MYKILHYIHIFLLVAKLMMMMMIIRTQKK